MKTLVQEISRLVDAAIRCESNPEKCPDWAGRHRDNIDRLCENLMPSGSGFDSGTQFDHDKSKPERLVFTFGYHHMSEHGYYDGWTEHTCVIKPSLMFGFKLRITGRNRNDIKDYAYEVFDIALRQEIG